MGDINLDNADEIGGAIGDFEANGGRVFDTVRIYTYEMTRTSVARGPHELRVEVLDAGPSSSSRYAARVTDLSTGTQLLGNDEQSVKDALRVIHWDRLDTLPRADA
ncbi:hypothetical protein [Nocardioides zeae]|uniref:Uncharacterized protein n=1 Tax=Nocardioides zeae TaxID=1457234 RepID=A0AAJ1X3P6_9ACTN|nr:hypothetical protein [Nocardioides zeae]MDQ1106624.1 hypothetical protein [Nocardioides zeae]